MKEKRPQFVKMNAYREENPPPRDVGCPDYRNCLTEAAFRNFCLDCSQCAEVDSTDVPLPPHPKIRPPKGRRPSARLSLSG
jgi:hypothetical protein